MRDNKQLDYMDKQIILYCKNWFKRTNTIDDLKIFVAKWAGIKVEYVKVFYIYQRLLEIFFIVCSQRAENMLLNLFKWKLDLNMLDIIDTLCEELGTNLKVFDSKTETVIVDLGEPDYSILPKKEE